MANSLASPADLLLRYDARLLGQLAGDVNVQLTPAQLLTNPVIQEHLDQGAGEVFAALYVAYKYTAAELATVTNTTASLLKKLVCAQAVVTLCERRGISYEDKFPMAANSLEMLQMLRNGERVLDLAGNEQAGLAQAVVPAVCWQRRAGLVVTERHFFPGCNYGEY